MSNVSSSDATRERIEINVGSRRICAAVHRTRRRVFRIEVRPSGQVQVFIPLTATLAEGTTRLLRRAGWILRELDKLSFAPAVTPSRHFVSGETYLLLGRPLRLEVRQGPVPKVHLEGRRLVVSVLDADDVASGYEVLDRFYTATAHEVFPNRLALVSPPFLRRGLPSPALVVRRMSKRWGSYTPHGRIVLNVDLVRASPLLIDYVICHELAHGFHSDHGKHWRKLLDTIMPDWQERKAHLEELLR